MSQAGEVQSLSGREVYVFERGKEVGIGVVQRWSLGGEAGTE